MPHPLADPQTPYSPGDVVPLAPGETATRLREAAAVFSQTTLLLTRWVVDTPEIEAKILFGDHIYRDAVSADKLLRRLEALAVDTGDQWFRPEQCVPLVEGSVRAATTPAKLRAMYDVMKPSLVSALEAHAAAIHPVWDEPTLRVLHEIIMDLAEQRSAATRLRADLQARFPDFSLDSAADAPGLSGGKLELTLPDLPARDHRFTRAIPERVVPDDAALAEGVRTLMHTNLMDLEIATIEACSRLIVEYPEMPRAFVLDMARQCWDEARHARACYQRLHELGGLPGDYPSAFKLWTMATGQPLEVRLAIHQRIGEWIGVDGAIWQVKDLGEKGDAGSARMFEFVVLDEITHVAFGNKWITYLANGDEERIAEIHEAALRRRREVAGTADDMPIFPFNRWACERAGFAPHVVDELEANFKARGSRFQ